MRFGALKAPGPSGARPEHLAELLGVKRRRTGNRLSRALQTVLWRIESGEMPEEARWITRSRTIFLKKKLGREKFRAYNENRRIRAVAVALTFCYCGASLIFFANTFPQIKEIFSILR